MDISPKKVYKWPRGSQKMFNVTNHQENTNPNHNELSLHTHQDGYYQKTMTTSVGKDMEKVEHLHIVGKNEKWCSLYGK